MTPNDSLTTLLLSIHPRYVEAIFSGHKAFEFRRIRPRLKSGDRLVIYVTKPICAILGVCAVEGVFSERPDRLWKTVGGFRHAGLCRAEFDAYFAEASIGYAIALGKPRHLPVALSLKRLVEDVPGFRPPQSYRYLRTDRAGDRRVLDFLSKSVGPAVCDGSTIYSA